MESRLCAGPDPERNVATMATIAERWPGPEYPGTAVSRTPITDVFLWCTDSDPPMTAARTTSTLARLSRVRHDVSSSKTFTIRIEDGTGLGTSSVSPLPPLPLA